MGMAILQGKSCGPYLSASAMKFMKRRRRYTNVRPLPFTFLRASAMLKHVIDIGRLEVRLYVCPSVRLSVTRWHGIKTAEHLVMISSPHDSPFILVLCIPKCSRNSDGVTPCVGAKYRWGIKFARFSTNNCRYISQTIQDIAMVAMEGE